MARVYGIDLGAYSVKLVVATPGFRHATVTHVLEQPIPRGDDPYELRAARVIGAMVRAQSLENETAYAALAGDQVFIHVLEFPFKTLRRAELAKAVGTELEGLLPVELEDMVFDFQPLVRGVGEPGGTPEVAVAVAPAAVDPAFMEPTATAVAAAFGSTATAAFGSTATATSMRGPVAPPAEGMRVLTCATRIDKARKLIEQIGEFSAEPRGLIAAPAAYARLAERISACDTSKGAGPYTAIIDLGHARTDVCVVVDGRTNYVRTIARGGEQITQAIATAWKLSYDDAERAKHRDGFIGSRQNPPPNPSWQHVHQVIQQELAPLARDLRRTLTACRAKTGATVGRAVLVGGTARLRGLPEFLNEELGIPTSLLTQEDNVRMLGPELAAAGPADVYCLAAGVAFEGATGRPSFDLRQGPLAYKADLSFLRAKTPWIALSAVIMLLFAGAASLMEKYKLKKAEAVLDARLAEESRTVFSKEMTADEVLAKVSPGEGGRSPIPKTTAYDLLLALSNAVPAKKEVKIDLEELDIKINKVAIRKASSAPLGEHNALKGIELFEENLKKSDCFKKFSDPDKKPGPDDTRQFSMTLEVGC